LPTHLLMDIWVVAIFLAVMNVCVTVFFSFFFEVPGFELRALCLLGWQSTTQTMSPTLISLG
jgi:hypothetical protein